MKAIKKIMVLAVSVACGATALMAQNSYMFDNPDNKVFFGARVALDISSAANGGASYSSNPGFSIGAVYNIPLYKNLYFEPGLEFFYNTFGTSKWNEWYPENGAVNDEGEPIPSLYQVDGSIRNLGFRVPLIIGYHFDFWEDLRVSVFTGPQMNVNLMARYKVDNLMLPTGAPKEDFDGSIFGTDGFKYLDFQWAFGAGVTYQAYTVSLSGAWGITRMKDSTEMLPRHLKRNLFTISLGYNF